MGELSGKVALVTGAGKNIGRSIALALAAQGAAVAVNTRASRDGVESVVKEIRDGGGDAELFMADIADAAAVQSMMDGVKKRFGRLDILILNAAYRNDLPFLEMDYAEWRRAITTNLDGTFLCIKAAVPHLIEAGAGSIVTFGGAQALRAIANRSHVAATKFGLVGLTRSLAKEFGEYNIRVNCVSPGPIATKVTRPGHHKPEPSEVPLGRRGTPEEIAAMVCFLCGAGGAFITGQTMHVNGGTLMGG